MKVNGLNYKVVDIYNTETISGLQAMTLVNEDGEHVIAYQGTSSDEMNDILTDAALVSGTIH